MLYSVDRLTRDVGCYFSVLGIYFAHTTERKILRMKFNEKLIEIRKKQGLSQEELGMELQVSRQTISKMGRQEFPKVKDTTSIPRGLLLNRYSRRAG